MDFDELMKLMDEQVAKGALTFVKWTCPKCGDRVVADTPNQFHPEGYTHTEREDGKRCGHLYTGPKWGLRAIYALPAS
jgi:rRNA maturation protein Nop10